MSVTLSTSASSLQERALFSSRSVNLGMFLWSDLERELERREGILKWMVRRNIKNYDDVADVVRKYYLNPEEIYNRTRLET